MNYSGRSKLHADARLNLTSVFTTGISDNQSNPKLVLTSTSLIRKIREDTQIAKIRHEIKDIATEPNTNWTNS